MWRSFRKWLAAVVRPKVAPEFYGEVKGMEFVEFYGGPKDGDRERLEVGRLTFEVVAYLPVVLSPWGLEEQPTDLVRVVVLGTYTRSVRGMEWQG